MRINPRSGDIHGTIIHECMHLIHREMLDSVRSLTATGAFRLGNVRSKLRDTDSYKHCQRFALRTRARHDLLMRDGTVPEEVRVESERLADYYEYLASDDEWLARSYAQLIQLRVSRRPNLDPPFKGRKAEPIERWLRIYLTPKELEGYERSMVKLFQSLGWV